MFESTRDFFSDAFNFRLEDASMLDIVLSLTGLDNRLDFGVAIHEFHKLTIKQRNYICCVLLERDQDPEAWSKMWEDMETEAFE